MKIYLSYFILFICSQSAWAQTSSYGENPESLFDFWVGKWNVHWEEQDGKVGRGTNEIIKILDDKVIQENFVITEGNNKGFKGTSNSVYQNRFDTWRQAWADNNGGYFDFIGKVDGEKRIFISDIIERGGNKMLFRMVFYDIKQNSLTWDWESSRDGGQTWDLNWRIYYERI